MEEDIQVEGVAQNGIEVLKFLEDGHDVDIILMDIRMPLMNGVKIHL